MLIFKKKRKGDNTSEKNQNYRFGNSQFRKDVTEKWKVIFLEIAFQNFSESGSEQAFQKFHFVNIFDKTFF